jgi:hypothetical protein
MIEKPEGRRMAVLVAQDRRVFSVDADSTTIGRDPGCTIALSDVPGLSPQHARIRRVGDRWLIESISAAEIQVIGKPLGRLYWLQSGDVIRLFADGPELRFDAAGDAAISDKVSSRSSTQLQRGWWLAVTAAVVVAGVGLVALLASGDAVEDLDDAAVGSADPESQFFPIDTGTVQHSHGEEANVGSPTAGEPRLVDFQDGIVCVGVDVGGYRYQWCTGWVLSTNRVVTSGRAARQLQESLQPDERICVYAPAVATTFVYARSVKTHPRYAALDAGAEIDPAYDLAVIEVDQSLAAALIPADSQLLRELRHGASLFVAGYRVPGSLSPIDPVRPPELAETKVTLDSSEMLPGELAGAPTLLVRLPADEGPEGSPVLSEDGRVIGTLSRFSHELRRVIPVDRLTNAWMDDGSP